MWRRKAKWSESRNDALFQGLWLRFFVAWVSFATFSNQDEFAVKTLYMVLSIFHSMERTSCLRARSICAQPLAFRKVVRIDIFEVLILSRNALGSARARQKCQLRKLQREQMFVDNWMLVISQKLTEIALFEVLTKRKNENLRISRLDIIRS